MSADPTNGQSNIDVILKAMAPDRREAFLKSRNRLKQFNENDEILALAHYLDTVVVMVDGLTKNVAAAMTAHTEPMANLTAQLKRVAAHGGWATFHPTKDQKGNLFHTLVIHLPGTDVGTTVAGDGFMNFPD